MPKKNISKAEKQLAELKKEIPQKAWQYVILKEFINLFSQNNRVLNFIYNKFRTSEISVIDDRFPLTEKELALYEQGKELTLEETINELLDSK